MILDDFEGEKWFSTAKGWNKEVSDAVKAELRGKRCTMQDFDAPHNLGAKEDYEFVAAAYEDVKSNDADFETVFAVVERHAREEHRGLVEKWTTEYDHQFSGPAPSGIHRP